ncbi:MAG: hypothetical protein EG822_13980 [Deltaproteobacteria bacterium]|nr:hypothetical protein [Deltaproteobacteria bacterium]TLN01239.1 MAG: hypothetical protein FDZ73_16690 [bacterium]
MLRIAILWVAGLITIVPYGTYYLFFKATRDEYALVITLVLFWIFGFWSIVGPIISVVKIRKIMNAFEAARTPGEMKNVLLGAESRETVIDLIATENRIPKFIAKRIFNLLLRRLSDPGKTPTTLDPKGSQPLTNT